LPRRSEGTKFWIVDFFCHGLYGFLQILADFYIVILRYFALVLLRGLPFLTAELTKVYAKDAKFLH